MIHISSLTLRTFAGMLLLSTMACKKLPNELSCSCEPDVPVYKKGGPSQPLAACGTLRLFIDSTQSPGAFELAFLGSVQLGLYNFAELGPNTTLRWGGNERFMVNSIGYRFSIDGAVTDLKHNPLVVIQDSKWYVYRNNIGRYNYDAQGLEVFDKLGHIVLSIDGLTAKSAFPNSLLNIQGIIPKTDSTVGYYKLGDQLSHYFFFYGTPEENKAIYEIYDSIPIQPIFRYTGPNWQHARL